MNGKQLKNSILQWAIQGKLVPQDPNDEPASVLLERIREEKARLVKEKKLFSKIDAFISGSEDAGMFWVYSRVAPGVPIEVAESAVWSELDALKQELVPQEELEKVRNRFAA